MKMTLTMFLEIFGLIAIERCHIHIASHDDKSEERVHASGLSHIDRSGLNCQCASAGTSPSSERASTARSTLNGKRVTSTPTRKFLAVF